MKLLIHFTMELNLFISIFTIVFALLPNANTSATKIVGGVDADPNEFPYQISLRIYAIHICGGSILTENWILTAAHCKLPELPVDLEAMAGEIDFDNEKNDSSHKQVRTITNLFTHEEYVNDPTCLSPYDIAVGKLSSPFLLNQFVSVINLPVENSVPTGTAILSGWGSVSRNATSIWPQILQKAELPIIDLNQCKELYSVFNNLVVDDSNVCAGDLSGDRSGCKGDSGGPLVQIAAEIVTQVGIVSYGCVPCGQENAPSVFTKVSFYLDWINTKINS